MLYYIYVLSGPLKGIITPLLPNQYSLILHSKEHIENKIENEKLTLYIPCNKKEHEKIITIMLDEHNTKNNKYKIEDGLDTSDDSLSTIMVNGIISSMQYEKKIQEKLTTLSQLSDAQSYTNLQIELSDYSITMSLASTLARKSLNIVETLLKAQ